MSDVRAEQLAVHAKTLGELSRRRVWRAPDRSRVFEELTRAASETLAVERVSIWLYDDERNRITCADLYEATPQAHTHGNELWRRDFPDYFAALEKERSLPAHDALTDPSTQAFAESYLKPLSIMSMLDAPILLGGSCVGVVCHESVGTSRRWLPEEELFAASIADFAALALETEQRRLAQRETEGLIQELEARNAELEGFSHGVSHDLRSPLITIRGFIQLLREDLAQASTERVRTDLERIEKAANEMNELLTDLLGLSRVGRVVRPPETVSLRRLVQEVLELEGSSIAQLGVQVEVNPELPEVHGDALRIKQVLQHLVENAVRFSSVVAHPRVEIGGRNGSQGAEFYVRDNGPGIEPAYHRKIFGLFAQLERHPGKTGVGLALVERIVRHHSGHVWVESEGTGDGATFWVRIPGPDAAGLRDARGLPEADESDGSQQTQTQQPRPGS